MITECRAREISLSKIATLHADFCDRVYKWYETMTRDGVKVYIYEGFRTHERQQELYNQGRLTKGRIVTNAMPGQSFHQYGRAFDWVPLVAHEKAEGLFECDWNDVAQYAKGKTLAESMAMTCLSWETPHIQDSNYKSWRDLAVTA